MLLKTTELAELINLSVCTIRRYVAQGKLSYVRTPGGHYRFRESDVYDLIRSTLKSTTTDHQEDAISRAKAFLIFHNKDFGQSLRNTNKPFTGFHERMDVR
jgi:excisionase family DNA binding protein